LNAYALSGPLWTRRAGPALFLSRWVASAFLAWFATACFNVGIPVRSADLPSPGDIGVHAQTSLVTYAPGEVEASDGSDTQALFGQRVSPIMEMFLLYPLLSGTVGLEVGVANGVAIDFAVGPQQLGADLRLALLQQRDGQPLSLSLAAGGAYRPFLEATTPWLLAGLDLSHRWTPAVVSANLYASYGPESHITLLSGDQRDALGLTDDEEGAPPYFDMTRDELRLHLASHAQLKRPSRLGGLTGGLRPARCGGERPTPQVVGGPGVQIPLACGRLSGPSLLRAESGRTRGEGTNAPHRDA
jgi:hypothetical protein